MVFFPNDTLTFYSRGTPVKDGEGIITSYDYTLYRAMTADVQPAAAATEAQLQGLSNVMSDDMIAFVDYDTGVNPVMKVTSTKFPAAPYELVQVAPWNTYRLLLLRPMQAGQVQ